MTFDLKLISRLGHLPNGSEIRKHLNLKILLVATSKVEKNIAGNLLDFRGILATISSVDKVE